MICLKKPSNNVKIRNKVNNIQKKVKKKSKALVTKGEWMPASPGEAELLLRKQSLPCTPQETVCSAAASTKGSSRKGRRW